MSAASQPPATGLFDRVMSHEVTRSAIGIGAIYAGYSWWKWDGDPIWIGAWAVAAIISEGSKKTALRLAPYHASDEVGPPSLLSRMLGHPILAWPIILGSTGFVALGIMGLLQSGGPLDGLMLTILATFLLPAAFVGSCNARRRHWLRTQVPSARTEPERGSKAPRLPPIVSIVAPIGKPAAPTVPDAILALPPPLLDLIRDGVARVKAKSEI